MRLHHDTTRDVPLVVIDDDPVVADHARALFAAGRPMAVVSSRYSDIMPFMLRNNGHTVALVANVDDTAQLAEAIVLVERRLGHVASVIRYASDLPTARHRAAGSATAA